MSFLYLEVAVGMAGWVVGFMLTKNAGGLRVAFANMGFALAVQLGFLVWLIAR